MDESIVTDNEIDLCQPEQCKHTTHQSEAPLSRGRDAVFVLIKYRKILTCVILTSCICINITHLCSSLASA